MQGGEITRKLEVRILPAKTGPYFSRRINYNIFSLICQDAKRIINQVDKTKNPRAGRDFL